MKSRLRQFNSRFSLSMLLFSIDINGLLYSWFRFITEKIRHLAQRVKAKFCDINNFAIANSSIPIDWQLFKIIWVVVRSPTNWTVAFPYGPFQFIRFNLHLNAKPKNKKKHFELSTSETMSIISRIFKNSPATPRVTIQTVKPSTPVVQT